MNSRLFVVYLRKPCRKTDSRDDPYWEFGSFGITGCHSNLTKNAELGVGEVGTDDRLAFIQGGRYGCKLILVTPAVSRKRYGKTGVELCWSKVSIPFCYDSKHAPMLAGPEMPEVNLPELGKLVNKTNCTTAMGKLASCLRSSCKPLDKIVADELIKIFEEAKKKGSESSDFIKEYYDALPSKINLLTKEQRKHKYKSAKEKHVKSSRSGCSRKKTCRK